MAVYRCPFASAGLKHNVWSGWDLSVTNDIVDIKVLDDCYNLYLEEAAEEANVFNYGYLYFFNRVVL